VFFLGDAVLADRYNGELLGDGSGRTRLLPARLGPTIARRQDRLDPLGYRHRIVQAFRGRERAGLLTTPVAKYIKLLPIPQSKAEVALALGNGDPLVVEEPIRRGRVVLVATSADASWTPMPMLPSYLPLVQEILACAVEGQVQQRNLLVGQALGASVPAAVGAAPLALELPEGRAEPLRMRTEGDASTWSYADTYTSGVYTARYGPPISRADAYAVNVDTVESDLTALTPEELRDEVLPGVPLVHRTTWENAEGQPVSPGIQRSGLTKSLLYGVLILLFVETLLARFLGRPSL